jgi:hypothetical protein
MERRGRAKRRVHHTFTHSTARFSVGELSLSLEFTLKEKCQMWPACARSTGLLSCISVFCVVSIAYCTQNYPLCFLLITFCGSLARSLAFVGRGIFGFDVRRVCCGPVGISSGPLGNVCTAPLCSSTSLQSVGRCRLFCCRKPSRVGAIL